MAKVTKPVLKAAPTDPAELTPDLVLELCVGTSNLPEEDDETQKLIDAIRKAIDGGYTHYAFGSRVLGSVDEDVIFENGEGALQVYAWYGQCLVDFYPLRWLIARKPAAKS